MVVEGSTSNVSGWRRQVEEERRNVSRLGNGGMGQLDARRQLEQEIYGIRASHQGQLQ